MIRSALILVAVGALSGRASACSCADPTLNTLLLTDEVAAADAVPVWYGDTEDGDPAFSLEGPSGPVEIQLEWMRSSGRFDWAAIHPSDPLELSSVFQLVVGQLTFEFETGLEGLSPTPGQAVVTEICTSEGNYGDSCQGPKIEVKLPELQSGYSIGEFVSDSGDTHRAYGDRGEVSLYHHPCGSNVSSSMLEWSSTLARVAHVSAAGEPGSWTEWHQASIPWDQDPYCYEPWGTVPESEVQGCGCSASRRVVWEWGLVALIALIASRRRGVVRRTPGV
jgi:hypothetical protein